MTPKSDETGNSSTLPVPELNPLLNPILNKNLGRWAEVYFTNPPERRDEAVLNLLRELESEPETPHSTLRRSFPTRRETRSSVPASAPADTTVCPECGFENETNQRFCGDCGAQIAAAASATSIFSPPAEAQHTKTSEYEPSSLEGESIKPVPQFGSILHLSDPAAQPLAPRSGDNHSDMDVPAFLAEEAESTPLWQSYRLYVGMALAVIIGGLAYLAWRGGQSAPEGSLFPAQAPPAAVQSSPPAPVPKLPQNPSPIPASTTGTAASDEKPQNATEQTPALTPKTSATPKDSLAVSTNGNQELATALGFLNGVGEHRDSAQAAQWLWKAVEKKNTAATVLLAGLYLRGDGVQKNCDQGRILLDAAADKGSKDAANLLRNLQAFGCE